MVESMGGTYEDTEGLINLPLTVKDIQAVVMFKEHAPDDARQMLADRVVEHLELSGFEIDEADQVMRKRPPTRNHG